MPRLALWLRSGYVAPESTWPKLSESQQGTIDFVRAANAGSYSVEMGHQLSDIAVRLELREIAAIYKLTHQETLQKGGLCPGVERTALPILFQQRPRRRCALRPGHRVGGQWALFLQRHLCHAIQQNFRLMNNMWGVPEDAMAFAGKCDQIFAGLRLYPLCAALRLHQ